MRLVPNKKHCSFSLQHGATLAEYAVLASLIAATCIFSLSSAGQSASGVLQRSADALSCAGAKEFPAIVCHHCAGAICYYALDNGGGTWGTDNGPAGTQFIKVQR